MGKFVKLLLIVNLCVWIYFGIAFAQASYPYRPDPLGHPAGTGYTFWGHSIAVVESGLVYPFFRVVFYADFPSFALAVLTARVFDHRLTGQWFFLRISEGGWILIGAMLLSFLQWYFIGWVVEKLWQRRSTHPTAAVSRA